MYGSAFQVYKTSVTGRRKRRRLRCWSGDGAKSESTRGCHIFSKKFAISGQSTCASKSCGWVFCTLVWTYRASHLARRRWCCSYIVRCQENVVGGFKECCSSSAEKGDVHAKRTQTKATTFFLLVSKYYQNCHAIQLQNNLRWLWSCLLCP